MATGTDRETMTRLVSVLIPVVVGSLLGLFSSIATKYYDARIERAEILRKEKLAHVERAMTLSGRYMSGVGKLLSIGMLKKGDITADDLAVMSLPDLRGDVEQIYAAHRAMMLQYDDIVGVHAARPNEDAVAYEQRLQKALAPSVDRVRSLMGKLAELAKRLGDASASSGFVDSNMSVAALGRTHSRTTGLPSAE
jgi:hypothetical protein